MSLRLTVCPFESEQRAKLTRAKPQLVCEQPEFLPSVTFSGRETQNKLQKQQVWSHREKALSLGVTVRASSQAGRQGLRTSSLQYSQSNIYSSNTTEGEREVVTYFPRPSALPWKAHRALPNANIGITLLLSAAPRLTRLKVGQLSLSLSLSLVPFQICRTIRVPIPFIQCHHRTRSHITPDRKRIQGR